jgi:threonine dehydrogenase-like Zn-dependent dehydrogenase
MRVLRYEAPRQARIVDSTSPRAEGKQSVAQTLATSVSAGTEMAFYRGTAPQLNATTDQYGLHHPAPGNMQYPMQSDTPGTWWMGYSAVGRIVEVGPDERDLREGDLVWTSQGHKAMMKSGGFTKLPADMDVERATFLALINIAFNGMLDARVKLLDDVVIFGMGTLGLLLTQMCRLSGARVTAVDTLPSRLALAKQMGAERVLNPSESPNIAVQVQELTRGRGADVVIEVTGNVDVLPEAIRCAGNDGIVTVMSFYQKGAASLQLSQEFHHKRITLRSSQIGGLNPELRQQYTASRRLEQAIRLAQSLELPPLISHRVPFEKMPEALQMIDQNPSACQAVVIKYT